MHADSQRSHRHDEANHHHSADAETAGHHHGHQHTPARFDRAFAIGIGLNLAFIIAEVVFGTRAHSLALTADAGHNLGDVLGLVMAWWASVLARGGPTPRRSYGLRRLSIFAALGNAGFLLVAVGAIGWEAIIRLRAPGPVASGTVMAVAAIGIVINTGTALAFMAGRTEDLNLRGAFLHMMGDAAASGGVVLAGLAIGVTGWLWLDPAVSLALALVIALGTWGLLRDSVNLALDAVPPGIDPVAVETFLESLPGVVGVHDLHIWGLSTTHIALTAHLVKPDLGQEDDLLTHACRELHARFRIEHATLQIESGRATHPCALASADVV